MATDNLGVEVGFAKHGYPLLLPIYFSEKKMRYFLYFLLAVNVLGAVLFALDKALAQAKRRRVPESTLHLLELFGGWPCMMLLMYAIHHKNRKRTYWLITWTIAVLWLVVVGYILYREYGMRIVDY